MFMLMYVSNLVSHFKMSPTTGFIFIFIFSIFGVPLKADTPKGAYTQELKPLNPYDIKGDDIDKGGEVSKGIKPFQICAISERDYSKT